MAVTVLWNAYVSLNAVDVSDKVRSVSLPMTIAELDATTMSNDTEIHEPGLKGFSWEAEFLNDFTDDDLDEDVFTLWNNRTKFAVKLRASATAIGAANPEYQFSAFIANWTPIAGNVGQLAGGTLTLSNTTVLTRATA